MKTTSCKRHCRHLAIVGACAVALSQVACTTNYVYRPYSRPSSGPARTPVYAPAYPAQGGYVNPPREETVNFY